MSKSKKSNLGWYSPQALAELANDGFLSIIRSTGKAAGYITFGTIKGIGMIGRSLTGKENNQAKGLSKAGSPLKQDTNGAVASTEPGDAPSPTRRKTAEYTESKAEATVKSSADDNSEEDKFPSLDLEALLKQYPGLNKIEAIKLRKILDDLLHGSQAERLNAIKALVGLSRFAEPLLIALLPTIASPPVADIALEGLSQIGSPHLVDCIMKTFDSLQPDLRLTALRAAHRLPGDQTQYFLERGLRDSNPKVRRRVLTYLSWDKPSWATTEIKRLCDDPDSKVKWAALEALLSVNASEVYNIPEELIPSLGPLDQNRAAALIEKKKLQLEKQKDETSDDIGRSPPQE